MIVFAVFPANSLFDDRWQAISPLLARMKSGYTFLPLQNDTFGDTDIIDDPKCFRVLILRSSPHADVEESLTHLVLYDQVLRHAPDALVDFAFFPPRADQPLLESAGFPWPLGVRSLLAPAEFDLVLLNVSYVLELLNVPLILKSAGLPLWSSERADTRPFIILGGSAALSAQSIARKLDHGFDSLVDALFFGEIEDSMSGLLEAVGGLGHRDMGQAAGVRKHQLTAMSQVPGCWVPTIANPVEKAVCRTIGQATLPRNYPVLNGQDATTCRLQISLGCPFSCSFCFEGHERKPYRDQPAADLLQATRQLKHLTGARSLDIVSFNFNTHRELPALMAGFSRYFRHVHFMSQRLDILNRTRFLLENELAADKRSYTLGIEGISQRFRRYFHKQLGDADINQLCLRLLQAKVKEIKFFFILSGLETGQDLAEFATFCTSMAEKRRLYHPGCRLIISCGVLCRMPFTPLQFSAIHLESSHYQPLVDACQTACTGSGIEFRTAFSVNDYQAAQLLCLGGWETNDLLMAFHSAGISFCGTLPPAANNVLKRFLAKGEEGLPPGFFGEKGSDWNFPLGFVGMEYGQDELFERYRQCLAALDCPPDPVPVSHVPNPQKPGPDQRQLLSGQIADKNRAPWSSWLVRIPAGVAGASPSWLDAWMARGLFELMDDIEEVVDVELDSRFRSPSWLPTAWSGLAIMRVSGPESLDEKLNSLVGRLAGNGLQLESTWDELATISAVQTRTYLPISLETTTNLWNRLLPGLGLAATLQKSTGRSNFIFPAKQSGKRVLYDLQLAEDGSGTTMTCSLGPKADWLKFQTGLFPGRFPPLLNTAIHAIKI